MVAFVLNDCLDYTEGPANASNYVLNKAAGSYRNDQSKKKNTSFTVTRHSLYPARSMDVQQAAL